MRERAAKRCIEVGLGSPGQDQLADALGNNQELVCGYVKGRHQRARKLATISVRRRHTIGADPIVPNPGDVTILLRAWRDGDARALDHLLPLVMAELRRLARAYMSRERPEHTLQTTALINEAYMRLVDAQRVQWQDRAHFLGIAARVMRRVLVDHARGRGYQKRGGNAQRVMLNEDEARTPALDLDVLALDRALEKLSAFDARKGRVVELRFFGGLTVDETAAVLNVSPDTAKRDWALAKLWLLRELEGEARNV